MSDDQREAELHRLAAKFFREFSRCEYALKAAGLLKKGKDNAEADWESFAERIGDTLIHPQTDTLKVASFENRVGCFVIVGRDAIAMSIPLFD